MAEKAILEIQVLGANEAEKAQVKLKQEFIANKRALNDLNKTIKENGGATDAQARQLVKLERANKEIRQEYRQLDRTVGAVTNSYNAMSAKMSQLRAQQKNINLSTKEGQQEFKRLGFEINRLNGKLKKMDADVGVFGRNVGNYRSAFNGLKTILGAAGIGSAVAVFTQGISAAIGVIRDFQKDSSNLAAVLGKTRQEITGLTEEAQRLGSVTAFTAGEVVQLQTEFAKLGFAEEQIKAMSEATLALAAASGTDLANAAEIAGSTVRSFGLSALDTQRVVDVMAKSFSSSSLDIEKFKVSIRQVAPVAKTAGLTIEETTAALGVLADNGVRAETAGTGLRNILLEAAKQGVSFEDVLSKVSESTDKSKTAMELFGKENAAVAVILSEQISNVERLDEVLQSAAGTAQQMADEQLNNLDGSLTKLSSAWEGLILSIENGDGVIGKTLKFAVDDLTNALNNMNTTVDESEKKFSVISTYFNVISGGLFKGLGKLYDKFTESERNAREALKENAAIEESLFNAQSLRRRALELGLEVEEVTIDNAKEQIVLLTEAIQKQEELNAAKEAEAQKERDIAAAQAQRLQAAKEAGADITRGADAQTLTYQDAINEIVRFGQAADMGLRATQDQAGSLIEGTSQQIIDGNHRALDDIKRTQIQTINDISDVSQQTLNALSAFNRARLNRELAEAGDNKEAQIQIEREFARRQQRINIIQAIIEGALGIVKTGANLGYPQAIPFQIAQGLQTTAQIALIKSQEFEQGGIADTGGVLKGKSHAEGGIPFSVGGRLGFEAEGQEAIINKRSTNMFRPLLSAINQAGGGVAFENGGIPATLNKQLVNEITGQAGVDRIVSAIERNRAVLPIPTLDQVNRGVNVVQQNARL